MSKFKLWLEVSLDQPNFLIFLEFFRKKKLVTPLNKIRTYLVVLEYRTK